MQNVGFETGVERLCAQWRHVEVVFLPKKCPELNAIELAWAAVKNRVAANFRYDHKWDDFRRIVDESFAAVKRSSLQKMCFRADRNEAELCRLLAEYDDRMTN